MTKPMVGGRRLVDKVLAADFLGGLQTASMTELRAKRHDAEQEEADLSFKRRMLQGRMDIIRAEQARRANPETGSLIEHLAKILSDPSRRSHGISRHLTVEPSRVDEYRRKEEAMIADAEMSDVASRTDEELASSLVVLGATEAEVSDVRHAVQQVMDVLTAEVQRRYREGLANVDELLLPPTGA